MTFKWNNFFVVFVTQSMTGVIGFVLLTCAFKFALLAELNQGCITSCLSIISLYVSIVFYFKFGEKFNTAKIVSIALIIACVVLLSLDPKEEFS